VTGTAAWDIPKGMRDPGEDTLAAAMRELREEAGLVFDAARFQDLGAFRLPARQAPAPVQGRGGRRAGDLGTWPAPASFRTT
jgi:8-oxo-dGTP pyrophosphatase MutT (NUDIX family)